MSDSNQSSYRSIFKATSLFGSVQFFQILIQIVKSKFIAILLGPAGVGIIGLYQSGMQLVQNITNMGLCYLHVAGFNMTVNGTAFAENSSFRAATDNFIGLDAEIY